MSDRIAADFRYSAARLRNVGLDNTMSRDTALSNLIALAQRQGYVLTDDILDEGDDLSLMDIDWLSSALVSKGVLVYDEAPAIKDTVSTSAAETYDYAQSDYEETYKKAIALSPESQGIIDSIKSILPPQRGEFDTLKYQVVDGNSYARQRVIEMHLRFAVRVAVSFVERYGIQFEDAFSLACIGLVTAVDKYDPDTDGSIGSFISYYMMQVINREMPLPCKEVYYPVHVKERWTPVYLQLKKDGCVGCNDLPCCKYEKEKIKETFPDISFPDIQEMIRMSMSEISLSELAENEEEPTTTSALEQISVDLKQHEQTKALNKALETLTPREKDVMILRYGLLDDNPFTLEEVGQKYSVTRERIRQIEAKALRKLNTKKTFRILEENL